MNKDKSKPQNGKQKSAKPVPPAAPAPPVKVPPMFRKIDWLAMGLVFLAVWAVYLYTLAPELTLEDSGELCTGAYYAGIPHPPGYPFWSIYAWFWTAILPFGNVAWRVEVGESFAAAFGCGLLALMVSRGSSMLIEGMEELKGVTRRLENTICFVSGTVTGLLLGVGAFMWKESVVINRISLFGVPWLLAVIVLLMRWMYAPQQRRYLYLAMLFYGWLATIHQSLILSSPGVEILIALVSVRLGRDLLLVNSILYFFVLIFMGTGNVPALEAMTDTEKIIFNVVGLSSIAAVIWLTIKTGKLGTEWKAVLTMALLWAVGVLVYLYEPISCMTDPPMQWGYPRTVEGFFHALSRGQYGAGEGTNIFGDPSRFIFQLYYLAEGLADSFSWVYLFIGLIPFAFLMKMRKRERNWIIGLTAIYFCISVILVIMLNVSPDRSTSELNKVFFTASHAVFAMMIGYGLTILAAYVAVHYEKIRRWCFIGGGVALVTALYCLVNAVGKLFFGPAGQLKVSWLPHWDCWNFLAYGPDGQFGISQIPHMISRALAPNHYGSSVIGNMILVMLPIIFLIALLFYRKRGPVVVLLAIFAVTPLCSSLEHWYKCEQRNHWFGYWFGHDMFTPPFLDPATGKLSYDNARRAELLKDPTKAKWIYPEMTRNAILFGGTDPGRFCPTYIIFCESFIPHRCQPKQDQKFDRRDVYIITQNALADGTYLDYLRAQYFRSQQHDPPFFSELSKYIFSLAVHSWRITMGEALDKDKNSTPDEAARENEIDQDVASHGLYGLVNDALYYTLDVPFTQWGKYVETYRRAEGVYPPKEIYIPSPEDSQNCFNDYYADVQRRMQTGQLQPGEDVHVDPNTGKMQVSGQVAVMMINGLLCKVIFDHNPTNEFFVEESFPLPWMYPYETPFGIIMKINRQPQDELTQEDFDRDHKFWSDYSSRLCGNWITYDTTVQQIADFVQRTYIQNDYNGFTGDRKFVRDEDAQKAFSKLRDSQAGMYAWRCSPQCPPEYREKTPALEAALVRETDFAYKQAFAFCPYSPEVVFRYVQFLMQYNRLDDALTVAQTCHKLDPYNDQVTGLINNLEQFKTQSGERAQLQSQLENMENEARTNPTNYQNIFSLARLYLQMQQTNRAAELLGQIQLKNMENEARTDPTNYYQNIFLLAGLYLQMQQTNRAAELLGQMISSPRVPTDVLRGVAQFYAQVGDFQKLETTLEKLTAAEPSQPETWYDLARLKVILGKNDEALKDLRTSIDLSDQRLKTNSAERDIRAAARTEPEFNALRNTPDFQKIVSP